MIAKANFYIFLFVWSALGGLVLENFIVPILSKNVEVNWSVNQDKEAKKEIESEEKEESNLNKLKEFESKFLTEGCYKFSLNISNNFRFYSIQITHWMPTHSGSCYLEIHSPPPELV